MCLCVCVFVVSDNVFVMSLSFLLILHLLNLPCHQPQPSLQQPRPVSDWRKWDGRTPEETAEVATVAVAAAGGRPVVSAPPASVRPTGADDVSAAALGHAGEWRDQAVTRNFCALDASCFGPGSSVLCSHESATGNRLIQEKFVIIFL